MIVQGFNSDLYYVNNPIWIKVTSLDDLARYVEVVLVDITDPANPILLSPLRLYPFRNEIQFGIDELIKGNFPKPKHPESPVNGSPVTNNFRKFRVTFIEKLYSSLHDGTRSSRGYNNELNIEPLGDGAQATFEKTFIRGGERSMNYDVVASVGDVLKEAEKIPRWGGYPLRKYYIDSTRRVLSTNILSLGEVDDKAVIGCDPMYVRFLNSKGGYGYWLFETFEIESRYESHGLIKRRAEENSEHFGFTTDEFIVAETRVEKKYWPLMHGLLRSPEVDVYNKFGKQWARIIMDDNDFMENNYDTIQKVTIRFKVYLNESPTTIW